jgi:hypothetical protein
MVRPNSNIDNREGKSSPSGGDLCGKKRKKIELFRKMMFLYKAY